MRLFTAVDIPADLRDELVALQKQSDLPVRWTEPEQFHVTLRFIGEVGAPDAKRYDEALAEVDVPPVRCVPYGLDTLPSRRSPRVLMLGLERTDSLVALYRAVSDTLEAEGLDPEERTYRPHVTIARRDDADPTVLQSFLRPKEDRSFSPFERDHFILYKSTLTPEGAIHEVQSTYALTE